MLVPRNPDSLPRKDPPTTAEKPTIYDYNNSQAPSKTVNQAEDEWLSLEATPSTGNPTVTKTPVNSMLSAPSVHNILSTPTNSNTPPPPRAHPPNVPPLCRYTMPDYPLKNLRRNCNIATRQFLFEKAENILPFQLTYPQDYPQEGTNRGHNPNERLQIRMNWVRNALTKNVLG